MPARPRDDSDLAVGVGDRKADLFDVFSLVLPHGLLDVGHGQPVSRHSVVQDLPVVDELRRSTPPADA